MSVLMVCGLLVAPVHALTLRELLDASSLSHPSVLAAKFGANAAQDSIEVAKRQNWPTLLAPADGVVNNIRATTLGAVLRPGDVVMELFPTGGDLIAEAKVAPADIAFVDVGQEAFVKLDAYDSTIFGSLQGRVKYISPDVLKEEGQQGPVTYYRVHVEVPQAALETKRAHDIVLRPGLTATVEIKALERSVLSYLTKPITKTLQNSLGER